MPKGLIMLYKASECHLVYFTTLLVVVLFLCPDVLKRGGNAADAAVAVAAALAVTEPCSTGPGGDAFCLFYNGHTGEIRGINGRLRVHCYIGFLLILGDYLNIFLCPQWPFTSSSDPGPVRRTWLHRKGPSFSVWCFECYSTGGSCMLVWYCAAVWKSKGLFICVLWLDLHVQLCILCKTQKTKSQFTKY